MIRAELIEKIAEENPHLTRRDVERVVAAIFEEITRTLEVGGRAELRGFGAFSVRERDERIGRNPKNGARVHVPAKRVPVFKTGKGLHLRMNPDQEA